ncbi:MAG TPA: BON domain-containing protein [Candidatus Dormibacteraeota bacterium]
MLDLKQVDLKQVKQVRDEVADRVGRAAKELTSTAQTTARKQLPKRRGASPLGIAAGALAGAAVVYLFDPQRGKARRAIVVQWTTARLRRGWRSIAQLTRYSTNTAGALPQRMVSLSSAQQRPTPDDVTLKDRIESEVFRDPEMPKGEINFDVSNGIVTIRGAVDNAFRIANIEKAVFKVPGVTGVENLLHVSGTPAPNKAEARESTR